MSDFLIILNDILNMEKAQSPFKPIPIPITTQMFHKATFCKPEVDNVHYFKCKG